MSQFELTDKVAIVTGGGGTSHGIGRCIAMTFAQAGAKIVVVGRHEESLNKVVEEINSAGGEAVAIVADITDPAQVDGMVTKAMAAFGQINILVNSAGGSTFGNPEDLSPAEWNDCISLNLNGTCLCCAAVAKEMIRQGGGKIVNIGSSSGLKGEEHAAHFSADAGSLGLPGTPQDVANAALYFASPGSDIMTGENLVVRGSEWASAYA